MKKIIIIFILVFLLSMSIEVRADNNIKLIQSFIAIGTGSVSGTYFPLGIAMAKIINSYSDLEVAFIVPTDGSVENIDLLEKGDIQFGFCQTDIFTFALKGKNMFINNPHKDLRGIISLYPEVIQLIVRADSDIWSVEDLRGKRVGVGNKKSGTKLNAELILIYHNLPFSEIIPDYSGFSSSIEKLMENKIDAIFLTAGIPTEAVSRLIKKTPVRLIALDKSRVKDICNNHNYFTPFTIDQGTYKGQNINITTIASRAMIVTSEKTPVQEVKRFLEILFREKKFLVESHDAAKYIKRNSALEGIDKDYLHKGTRLFFNIK